MSKGEHNYDFYDFPGTQLQIRWAFLATNLANIHVATNLTKILIFHNSCNFRKFRKIRSFRWTLQQILLGKYNRYNINIPPSFNVFPDQIWQGLNKNFEILRRLP